MLAHFHTICAKSGTAATTVMLVMDFTPFTLGQFHQVGRLAVRGSISNHEYSPRAPQAKHSAEPQQASVTPDCISAEHVKNGNTLQSHTRPSTG